MITWTQSLTIDWKILSVKFDKRERFKKSRIHITTIIIIVIIIIIKWIKDKINVNKCIFSADFVTNPPSLKKIFRGK